MKYQQGNEFIKFNTLYIITSVTETEVEFLNMTENKSGYKRFTKMSKETFEECYEDCFWEIVSLADIKINEYTPSTYNIEDLF